MCGRVMNKWMDGWMAGGDNGWMDGGHLSQHRFPPLSSESPTRMLWLDSSGSKPEQTALGASTGLGRSCYFSPLSETGQTKAFVFPPLLGPSTAQGGKLLASQQVNFATTQLWDLTCQAGPKAPVVTVNLGMMGGCDVGRSDQGTEIPTWEDPRGSGDVIFK